MPRTPSGSTIGVLGLGETSAKNIQANLKDFIEANGASAKFILPASKTLWTPTVEAVANFAYENDFPYEVVADDSAKKSKAIKEWVDSAAKVHQASNIHSRLLSLVTKAEGTLVVLWDDEDEETQEAVEEALESGVEALDLTSGLERIEFASEDDEPAEVEEEEPDIEAEVDEFEADEVEDEDSADVGADTIDAATIKKMDHAALKELAQEWGVEVAPRTKTPGYRKALIEHLENQPKPLVEVLRDVEWDEDEARVTAVTDKDIAQKAQKSHPEFDLKKAVVAAYEAFNLVLKETEDSDFAHTIGVRVFDRFHQGTVPF